MSTEGGDVGSGSSSPPPPGGSASPVRRAPLLGGGKIFGGGPNRASVADPHGMRPVAPVFDDDVDGEVARQSPARTTRLASNGSSAASSSLSRSPLHSAAQVAPNASRPQSPRQMAQQVLDPDFEHNRLMAVARARNEELARTAAVTSMYSSRINEGPHFPSSGSTALTVARPATSPLKFSASVAGSQLLPATNGLLRQQAPVVTSVLHLKPTAKTRLSGSPTHSRRAVSPTIAAEGRVLASMGAVFRDPAAHPHGSGETLLLPGGLATAERAMIRQNPHGYTVADVDRLRSELRDALKESEKLRKENQMLADQLREAKLNEAELTKRFEHNQRSLNVAVETIRTQEIEIAHLRQSLSGEVYDNGTLREQFKNLITVAKSELGTLREQVKMQERAAQYVGGTQTGPSGIAPGHGGLVHPFDRVLSAPAAAVATGRSFASQQEPRVGQHPISAPHLYMRY